MPMTALLIDNERVAIITIPGITEPKDGEPERPYVLIKLVRADDNYQPILEAASQYAMEYKKTEEEIHKGFRVEYSVKGQYVKEFSTNPEWNEEYIPPPEENTN